MRDLIPSSSRRCRARIRYHRPHCPPRPLRASKATPRESTLSIRLTAATTSLARAWIGCRTSLSHAVDAASFVAPPLDLTALSAPALPVASRRRTAQSGPCPSARPRGRPRADAAANRIRRSRTRGRSSWLWLPRNSATWRQIVAVVESAEDVVDRGRTSPAVSYDEHESDRRRRSWKN